MTQCDVFQQVAAWMLDTAAPEKDLELAPLVAKYADGTENAPQSQHQLQQGEQQLENEIATYPNVQHVPIS